MFNQMNQMQTPAEQQGFQQQMAQQQQLVAQMFNPQAIQQKMAMLADPAYRAQAAQRMAQQGPPPPMSIFDQIVGSGNRAENSVGLPVGELGSLMQPQPSVPTVPSAAQSGPGIPPGLALARTAQAAGPSIPPPSQGLAPQGGMAQAGGPGGMVGGPAGFMPAGGAGGPSLPGGPNVPWNAPWPGMPSEPTGGLWGPALDQIVRQMMMKRGGF